MPAGISEDLNSSWPTAIFKFPGNKIPPAINIKHLHLTDVSLAIPVIPGYTHLQISIEDLWGDPGWCQLQVICCQVPTDGDPLRFPQDALDHGEAHRRWDTQPYPAILSQHIEPRGRWKARKVMKGINHSMNQWMNEWMNQSIISSDYSARHLFLREIDMTADYIISDQLEANLVYPWGATRACRCAMACAGKI